MTQEEKELSFIDISGRLHYGVIVNYKENEYDHHKWKITNLHTLSYSQSGTLIDTDYDGWISYEEHKGCGASTGSRHFRFGEVLPYLRPMSSMTEEEKRHVSKMMCLNTYDNGVVYDLTYPIYTPYYVMEDCLNYLRSIHVDYLGLIEKGLAIEVTKDNNPYEQNKS